MATVEAPEGLTDRWTDFEAAQRYCYFIEDAIKRLLRKPDGTDVLNHDPELLKVVRDSVSYSIVKHHLHTDADPRLYIAWPPSFSKLHGNFYVPLVSLCDAELKWDFPLLLLAGGDGSFLYPSIDNGRKVRFALVRKLNATCAGWLEDNLDGIRTKKTGKEILLEVERLLASVPLRYSP